MEMPFDVISHHLLNGFDEPLEPDNARDHAMDIDQELQHKFIFIPMEEIDAVKIEDSKDGAGFYAGSGPETIRAGKHDNPNWLYNSAVHALAMYQHLKSQEEKAKHEAEQKKLARRPLPGVYHALHLHKAFVVIVTEDRRLTVPMDDGSITDQTGVYDTVLDTKPWVLHRIDITTGTTNN